MSKIIKLKHGLKLPSEGRMLLREFIHDRLYANGGYFTVKEH